MQVVLSRSKPDLLAVLQRFLPLDVWVAVQEAVVMVMPFRIRQMVTQLAVANRRCLLAEVGTCLIQSNRIERSKHPDVGQDGSVILIMAVTVR